MPEPTCEQPIEVPRGICGQPVSQTMMVWADDEARVSVERRPVCADHARALLSAGNAATVAMHTPGLAACVFADSGNGPCGGPSNGVYCWDHKDLR